MGGEGGGEMQPSQSKKEAATYSLVTLRSEEEEDLTDGKEENLLFSPFHVSCISCPFG